LYFFWWQDNSFFYFKQKLSIKKLWRFCQIIPIVQIICLFAFCSHRNQFQTIREIFLIEIYLQCMYSINSYRIFFYLIHKILDALWNSGEHLTCSLFWCYITCSALRSRYYIITNSLYIFYRFLTKICILVKLIKFYTIPLTTGKKVSLLFLLLFF